MNEFHYTELQNCATVQFAGAQEPDRMPLPPAPAEKPPKKRGTKRPKKLYFYTVGLAEEEWGWLEKWMEPDVENRTRTDLMRELFARAMIFWPEGIHTRPIREKPRRRQLPHAAINRYAQKNGMSKEDALILAWETLMENEETK